MDHTDIKRLAEYAKKYASVWATVGIRVQTSDFGVRVGDTLLHRSYVWDDGEQLDYRLDGVCAIGIDLVKHLDRYGGYDGHVALILSSDRVERGTDPAEVIMRDPKVLEIIHL